MGLRGIGALRTRQKEMGYALDLLLERRWLLYIIGDVFLLFNCMMFAIGAMSGKDWLAKLYPFLIVTPNLLLGLPALASVIAVERRSGSLDLALAVPSTERYFVRRVLPVCGLMLVQNWILLLLVAKGWDLARALCQASVLPLFLTALALFWASRLRTSGAVLAASLLSVALMSPWIFVNPVTTPPLGKAEELFGIPLPDLAWTWRLAVLALASLILYLYARQRLRQPEAMLA